MMIPPKLTHGDNLANLFEKFNTVIDYLREIRLVAGNGIRINRLPAGTTIESTATAGGGGASSPGEYIPRGTFDVEVINAGTEENPTWKLRVYNSADTTGSGVAGLLIVGRRQFEVEEEELEPPEGESSYRYLYLDVVYDPEELQYTYELKITEDDELPQDEEREYTEVICMIYSVGYGKPLIGSMRALGNIIVTGRWV